MSRRRSVRIEEQQMGVHDTLASAELMDKLAALEPEEAPKGTPGKEKTAAVQTPARGASARNLLKVGELLDLARKAGAARADVEYAALAR